MDDTDRGLALIYFLDIVIDTEKRGILKHGQRLKTSTLNFDLLVYFANHANQVISRDELMENVWYGRVVSDATIYKQVTRLKKDMLNQFSNEELIQTVHGQGFIFVADVTSEPFRTTNIEMPNITNKTRKKTYIWLLVILLTLVMAFIIYQVYSITKVS